MRRHEDVKKKDEALSGQDWRDLLNIRNAYVEEKSKIVAMHSKFESIANNHFVQTFIAEHEMRLFPADKKRISFPPYRLDANASKFGKIGINKTSSE